MAIPLTSFLNEQGAYEGFDTSEPRIKWCQERITPAFPNFVFRHANLYTKMFNPVGEIRQMDFTFPYPDECFNVVLLYSVFTHMLPSDMEHYFGEIARVLTASGHAFISYFLINSESVELLNEGKSVRLGFAHDHGPYRTESDRNPELSIAYDESYVKGLFERVGLEIVEPVRYGSWCGRPDCFEYQDTIIAEK